MLHAGTVAPGYAIRLARRACSRIGRSIEQMIAPNWTAHTPADLAQAWAHRRSQATTYRRSGAVRARIAARIIAIRLIREV